MSELSKDYFTLQKMTNEKTEEWKSQLERKLVKLKGRTKAVWIEIYYVAAAAAGKKIEGDARQLPLT